MRSCKNSPWIVWCGVLLFIAYPLTYGPVRALYFRFEIRDEVWPVIRSLYAPVGFLMNEGPDCVGNLLLDYENFCRFCLGEPPVGTLFRLESNSEALATQKNYEAAQGAALPEYLWTYRENDGVVPPGRGTVFCVVSVRDDPGINQLLVFNERAMSLSKLADLSAGTNGRPEVDPAILLVGRAPSREIAFHRMDVDGDKVDEVLLTGRGGAGGTSFLSVLKVEGEKISLLYSGSSRFGFYLVESDPGGRFEIANAGFDWVAGDDHIVQEKEFTVYRLDAGKYVESAIQSRDAVMRIVAKLSERRGNPLVTQRSAAVLRVFDSN